MRYDFNMTGETAKDNKLFELIARVLRVSGNHKNDKGSNNAALSSSVGMARFELATSWSQTRRDNRATLHPELLVIDLNELFCGEGGIRTHGTV